MISFLLASSNQHKAEEFKALFPSTLTISAAPAAMDVDETGKSFTENAFIKAKAYFDKYKVPTLADDSGLVLEAMPELLGIHSARFASDLPSYSEKCQRVIKLLDEAPKNNRKAYFVCVLCFYLGTDEVYFFEGRVHGEIGSELRGENGFGYDPIFVPERGENDGLTLAELPEWKNEFSHRAKAAKSASDFFKENIDKLVKKL